MSENKRITHISVSSTNGEVFIILSHVKIVRYDDKKLTVVMGDGVSLDTQFSTQEDAKEAALKVIDRLNDFYSLSEE